MPIDMREVVHQGTFYDVWFPILDPPPTLSDRLLVLACSATKDPNPDKIPAIRRYQGPLWQTLRTADPEGSRCQVAFLSAYYGGLACARTTRIANYDRRLTPEQAKAWVETGIKRWHRYGSTTETAKAPQDGTGIVGMAYRAAPARRFREVCLVGGHLYLDVMRAELPRQLRLGMAPGATVTEINGAIGQMRQRLRAWLEAG